MAEPINCPFCGGAAICDPVPVGKAGDYYKVFCRSVLTCGAAGSARPDRDDAIGMWNRRAGQHVAATEPPLFWRCFHCDYVTASKDEARAHFGNTLTNDPTSCLLMKLEAKELIIDQLCAKLNERTRGVPACSVPAIPQRETTPETPEFTPARGVPPTDGGKQR